jgi:hypothetical protein
MSEFQGTRIEDGELPMNPGEYSKAIAVTDDGDVVMWWMKSPIGGPPFQIGPKPIGGGHEVDENSDGTITVEPKPDNSNSILISWGNGRSWHGYIYSGVWRTA